MPEQEWDQAQARSVARRLARVIAFTQIDSDEERARVRKETAEIIKDAPWLYEKG